MIFFRLLLVYVNCLNFYINVCSTEGTSECTRNLYGDLYRDTTNNCFVKYNPIAASRAGRSTTVDTLRSKRIAAAIQANGESFESDSAADSSDCSSSEGEESDSEYGKYSSDDSSQGK